MRTTKEAHFNIQGYAQMQRNVISSVQLLSRVRLFVTPWSAAHQASLPITNSWSIQTHVHRVDDAIQPSHPLSSPSPPAFNLSQHQGLFKWVSSVEFQLQLQSFLPMNIQDWFPLGKTGLISLQSKGLSGVLSSSTVLLHRIKQGFLLLILHPFQWTSALRIFPVCFIHELNN